MKKALSIILAIIMFLPVGAAALTDGTPLAPPSEWAIGDVKKAEALNVTEKGKTYRYSMPITREEFCNLAANMIEASGVTLSTDNPQRPLGIRDTDNVNVLKLYKAGIILGKEHKKTGVVFAPDDLLTREEAATILFRLIQVAYPDWAAHELYYEFTDSADISDWAMEPIQRICNMAIMEGVENNRFAPKATYTTEQAIATLVRVYTAQSANTEEASDAIPFADKLNAQMPKDKNYMFSPMSIKMALSLAANGASGETQAEILKALGITNLDDFNALSKDLIARYSQTDILSLNIANSIWMNKDKTTQNFSKDYKKTVADFYDAEVKSVQNANAVKEINGWVSDKTNGKIPTIIENADDFWAMLINAIYFKGAWQDEFHTAATRPDTFTSADGTTNTVDFMNKTKWFAYAETSSAKILELPYKNRVDKIADNGEYLGTDRYDNLDVSMYLLLAEDDINIEQELSAAFSKEAFGSTYIKLSMPKFCIEYSTGLNDMLMNLGIATAFNPNHAEFQKMFDQGNMWFTNTLHKTYIKVDEKGTEAAAVTAIGMAGSARPPEPIELKFDKPFYFAIRDNTSGEILFMGRYAFAN
ncbi:MAG: serpin family protein [Ruminococcaceae bacterium]|nr:serpin family protein [Oscillospiraceae bacterium]